MVILTLDYGWVECSNSSMPAWADRAKVEVLVVGMEEVICEYRHMGESGNGVTPESGSCDLEHSVHCFFPLL